MLSSLALCALLAATPEGAAPPPAAGEGSAAVAPQPAPPSAADATVAAAFQKHIDTAAPDLKALVPAAATPGAVDWTALAAPALGLLGLLALAVAVTRRKGARAGQIAIVESAALGPKRSLVIADVLGDRLVLAVSEAGVSVLSTRPAPAPTPAAAAAASALVDAVLNPGAAPAPRPSLLRRLFGGRPAPRFEDQLAESLEDQELRAKLAAGLRGVAP